MGCTSCLLNSRELTRPAWGNDEALRRRRYCSMGCGVAECVGSSFLRSSCGSCEFIWVYKCNLVNATFALRGYTKGMYGPGLSSRHQEARFDPPGS